jgi:hypothetical protein
LRTPTVSIPTSPPPRPPALDPARTAAARVRLAAGLRSCLDQLAADLSDDREPIQAYAGCRLLAWMLADLPGAYVRRDLATVERVAREVERLAARLPKHLADVRKPYSWAERGPVELELGPKKSRPRRAKA